MLIAVVLSAQATDKGVNKATTRLFAVANTPQAILALGLEGLKEYIKTIGLYRFLRLQRYIPHWFSQIMSGIKVRRMYLYYHSHLYNAKGENIIKLCRQLMDVHAGQVPETREELEALAGDLCEFKEKTS